MRMLSAAGHGQCMWTQFLRLSTTGMFGEKYLALVSFES